MISRTPGVHSIHWAPSPFNWVHMWHASCFKYFEVNFVFLKTLEFCVSILVQTLCKEYLFTSLQGLMDFPLRLVDIIHRRPDGQVNSFDLYVCICSKATEKSLKASIQLFQLDRGPCSLHLEYCALGTAYSKAFLLYFFFSFLHAVIIIESWNISFFKKVFSFFFFRTNAENETFTRIRRDPNGLKLPMSPSGKILLVKIII